MPVPFLVYVIWYWSIIQLVLEFIIASTAFEVDFHLILL